MLLLGCVDSTSANYHLLEGIEKEPQTTTILIFKTAFSDYLCSFHVKATLCHCRSLLDLLEVPGCCFSHWLCQG